jgi:acetyl esterase/lipase
MIPRLALPAVLAVVVSSFALQAQTATGPAVVFERDIEYAHPGEDSLKLNLARPASAKAPAPIVLCIHGGGFRAGSREGYDPLCRKLAEHGFVAATMQYRLAPKHPFPAAVHDTKAAVRWLRLHAKELNADPNRLGVTGSSAGGHLAQFLGTTAGVPRFEGDQNPGPSSAVTCVVNVYGPSDFTKSYGKSVDAHEVLPLWLGGNLETALPRHIESSPLNWVTPAAAPTLLIHGTEDKYVAYEQALWMRDRLAASGVSVQLLTLEGAGHGFKGIDAEKAENALITYFESRLKPAP